MKIIDISLIGPNKLNPMEKEWVYNGLDCIVTAEVLEVLLPQLDNHTAATYNFSRDLQGPCLEMRLRGILIDQSRKQAVIDGYFDQIDRLEQQLERIVFEGIGLPHFNWGSNKDLSYLFYDVLSIPAPRGKRSVDRNALEKLDSYLIARQIVRHITAMREMRKKIGMLRTEIDPDGRIRTSYNIAGTDTGRFSSSFSEFGTGTNLQNIEEALRSIFIADPGMKFAKFDAKSGESFVVGAIEWNLFHDSRYLDACESGDPHTYVARLCWPNLPWTDNLKRDKELAEEPYYRHYSYRFMCKKLGHGSNYGGKAQTLSTQAKVPIEVVEQFQPTYFKAFPAHLQWHEWVDNQIRRYGTLISLSGRKRQFWGRRNSDETLRAAIAYDPQGSLSDIVNSGMLTVWNARDAILMKQDHDAITVQYPEELEDEVIPKILKQLEYPVELKHNRTLLIPYDAKVGWNLGNYSGNNPDGLKDYEPNEKRRRTPKVSIMDRKLCDIH